MTTQPTTVDAVATVLIVLMFMAEAKTSQGLVTLSFPGSVDHKAMIRSVLLLEKHGGRSSAVSHDYRLWLGYSWLTHTMLKNSPRCPS